jgi:hypothetical protein
MWLLGFLFLLEAALTGLWITRLLPSLGVYDATADVLIASRALVGAVELMTWWLIHGRRPTAVPLARVVLVASAVLTTLEIGWRIAPSNMDPAWRWPYVTAYWIYAAGWLLFLWWRARGGRGGRPASQISARP